MRRKSWKMWLSGALVIMLMIATGCEALQGYEIGKALQKSAAVTSGESKGSISLELVPGDSKHLDGQDKLMFDLFKNLKVNILSAKSQDPYHTSIDAELSYAKGKIPFKLEIDGDRFIVNIAGSKKPIVISTVGTEGGELVNTLMNQGIQQDLQKMYLDFIPVAAQYFFSHAPNPKTISLTNVNEKVNNETLNMKKLHAEIYGDEFEGLIKKFLTSILADEKGLKELLGQLYDILIPTIKTSMSAIKNQLSESANDASAELFAESSFFPELIMAYMDNKTLMVEFSFTTIQQAVKLALKEMDKESLKSNDALADSPFNQLFSNQTYIKLDLYIDQDQMIRKQQVDLNIPIDSKSTVSAIRIKTDFENWNMNKPTTINKIDLTKGQLDINEFESFNELELLNNLDPSSQLYKLLKEDLQITKKEFSMILDSESVSDQLDDYSESDEYEEYDEYEDYGEYSTNPFINDKGVAMVPVRFVEEQLGALVEWDENNFDITTIFDYVTGTTIIITVDSDIASVNGKEVKLESPVIIKNGEEFLPLRLLAQSFNLELKWDASTRMIHISRD